MFFHRSQDSYPDGRRMHGKAFYSCLRTACREVGTAKVAIKVDQKIQMVHFDLLIAGNERKPKETLRKLWETKTLKLETKYPQMETQKNYFMSIMVLSKYIQ